MASPRDEDRFAFKQAFVTRCRAAGMDNRQILQFVKAAKSNDPTWGMFAGELARVLNPWGASGPKGTNYADVADKWYNPWTKNTDPMSKGEAPLMWAGRTFMGAGALASALAGGLAAAPALGGTAIGATPLFGTANAAGAVAPGLTALGSTLGSGLLGVGGRALNLGGRALGLGGRAARVLGIPAAMGYVGAGLRRLPVPRPESIGSAAGLLLLGAPLAGGLALGGLGGHAAAKMSEPDENEEDIKAREIETAYKVQASRLKARRAYEQYRQSRKTAAAEKSASLPGAAGLLLLGAPLAGGLALGGLGGYAAAKMGEPDENEEDIKAREIETAYREQANRLRARRAYEEYRKQRQS